jgi:hypothetical protein
MAKPKAVPKSDFTSQVSRKASGAQKAPVRGASRYPQTQVYKPGKPKKKSV